ncbi:MAG: hypothetical protein PF489_05270, partial [Salinivirgaceae bacterium]|nr:hypothetical protein [Salinivirgaceae bacterium]
MKLIVTTLFAIVLFTACNTGEQAKTNNSDKEQEKSTVQIPSELVTVLKYLPEYHLVYPYELPDLAYEYNALEPYIDAKTMETHHSKHHKGYTKKTNMTIEENNLQELPLISMFAEIDLYGNGIRNNGGGYYSHYLYWTFMSPGGTDFKGEVAEAIRKQFKSYEAFQEKFA